MAPTFEVNFKIGDKVVVDQFKTGILRYLGPTKFKEGIWAGVELDLPLGKNDGSVNDVQYFVCPPLKGLFINPEKLALPQFKGTRTLPNNNEISKYEPLSKSANTEKFTVTAAASRPFYQQEQERSEIRSPPRSNWNGRSSMLKTPTILQKNSSIDKYLSSTAHLEDRGKDIDSLSMDKTVAFSKLNEVENQLSFMEIENENLKKEIERLRNEGTDSVVKRELEDSFQKLLREKELEIARLANESKWNPAQYLEQEEEPQQVKRSSFKEQREVLQREHLQLEPRDSEHDQRIEMLKNELYQAQRDLQDQGQEALTLRQENSNLMKKLEELEHSADLNLESVQRKLENERSLKIDLEKRFESIEQRLVSDIERLKSDLVQAKRQEDLLLKQIQHLEASSQSKESNEYNSVSIKRLESDLMDTRSTLSIYQQESERLNQVLKSLNSQIDFLKKESENLKKENETLKSNLMQEFEKKTNEKIRVDSLVKEYELAIKELKRSCDLAIKEAQNLKIKLDSLQQGGGVQSPRDLSSFKIQLKELKSKNDKLVDEKLILEEKVSIYENEMNSIKSKHIKDINQLKSKTSQNDSALIEKLKNDLKLTENKLFSVEQQKEQLSEQYSQLVKRKEIEINNFYKVAQVSDKEISDLELQVTKLEKDLNLTDTNDLSEKQINSLKQEIAKQEQTIKDMELTSKITEESIDKIKNEHDQIKKILKDLGFNDSDLVLEIKRISTLIQQKLDQEKSFDQLENELNSLKNLTTRTKNKTLSKLVDGMDRVALENKNELYCGLCEGYFGHATDACQEK